VKVGVRSPDRHSANAYGTKVVCTRKDCNLGYISAFSVNGGKELTTEHFE
jgi:hypothetical protein